MRIKRINRISEEVKKVISQLLYNGIKDPRINSMVSVTKVEVTRDLSYANIYISVLGSEEEKASALEGLQSAKGYIRKEIGRNLKLRHVPEPRIFLDESIEKGIEMTELIKEVNKDSEDVN